MKSKIRHGSVLVCDYPKCKARFPSYSVPGVVRAQAASQGWARVFAWQIDAKASPRLKKDVCGKHAPIAAEALGKRKEMLAKQREQDKAERAKLREAKAAVKKAERDKERAEKKAQREGDRAIRKAAEKAERASARAIAKAAKKAERDKERAEKDAERELKRAKKKADALEVAVHGAKIHVAEVKEDASTESEGAIP